MKVYLGNNLGYRLQLISANQKRGHSRLPGHQFQRAKMSPLFSHYAFLLGALKISLELKATLMSVLSAK